MTPSRRALLLLDESISTLEKMASSREPLEPRKLDRLFGDIHSIQRSMRKLEKAGARSRQRFWKLQRKAAELIVKIAKHLSTS